MSYTQQFRDCTRSWPESVRTAAKMVIVDLDTGAALYESETREVKPTETVTLNWTRAPRAKR